MHEAEVDAPPPVIAIRDRVDGDRDEDDDPMRTWAEAWKGPTAGFETLL